MGVLVLVFSPRAFSKETGLEWGGVMDQLKTVVENIEGFKMAVKGYEDPIYDFGIKEIWNYYLNSSEGYESHDMVEWVRKNKFLLSREEEKLRALEQMARLLMSV